jgi:hypothetical protein
VRHTTNPAVAGSPGEGPDDMLNLASDYFDEAEALPAHLVQAAGDLYTWHTIDAELLELLVDSAAMELNPVRAEVATRMIAFGGSERGLHIECVPSGSAYVIEGQLVPAGPVSIDVERPGEHASYTTDASGSFRTAPLAPGSLRLVVRSDTGERLMLTPWFVLGQ